MYYALHYILCTFRYCINKGDEWGGCSPIVDHRTLSPRPHPLLLFQSIFLSLGSSRWSWSREYATEVASGRLICDTLLSNRSHSDFFGVYFMSIEMTLKLTLGGAVIEMRPPLRPSEDFANRNVEWNSIFALSWRLLHNSFIHYMPVPRNPRRIFRLCNLSLFDHESSRWVGTLHAENREKKCGHSSFVHPQITISHSRILGRSTQTHE